MANNTIPLKLDQTNQKISEFESGVDCVDPQFVEADPQVALNTTAIAANAAGIAANDVEIGSLDTDLTIAENAISANAGLIAGNAADIATNNTAIANNTTLANQGIADAAAANANADTRVQSVTGPTVDNADPINPVIALPLFEFAENFVAANSLTVATDLLSGGYTPYLTLTTSDLPLGTYEFTVDYVWSYDSAVTEFLARTVLDGDLASRENLASAHREEPADSLGAGTPDETAPGSGSDQWLNFSFRRIYTSFSGVHTFVLERASTAAGTEATFNRAVLAIRRVG